MVAMVLLLKKSLRSVHFGNYVIWLRDLPSNDALFAFPTERLKFHICQERRQSLNPDPSFLFKAIRAVICQHLSLIKHRTAIPTVDLGNNNRPDIFYRRCGTLPGTLHLFLTPVLKKQDCDNKNNDQR
jgi:hypothetical protein